ncbi:MAG: DUF6683 family protein [Myxococcaceae bacterium]
MNFPSLKRLVALVVVAVSAAAQAQYVNTLNGMQFNNIYAANADFMLSQMIQSASWKSLRQIADNTKNAQGKPPAAPVKKATWQFALNATDFKPAGARQVPEQIAAGVKDPNERKQLVDLCRTILSALESQPDVRKNNLAMGLTVLLGASLQVVAQRELNDAESEELLRTINDTLATLDGFKKMDPAGRTRAYDAFMITGGLIAGMAEAGKDDPAAAKAAATLAVSTLQQFGLLAK